MVLQNAILKAFSFAIVCALTLGPGVDESSGDAEAAPAAANPQHAPPGALAAPSETPRPSGPCGSMLLVEGDHCADIEQTCLKWLDPPPYQNLRCGEYAKPAKCKSAKTTHRRFCIDRDEYSDTPDNPNSVPTVNVSWLDAKAKCEARGARLCKAEEWELACEGPEMQPYPYGWQRSSTTCNIDRTDLGGPNEKLIDHRAPLNAFPECKSPFGVHDMTGNVDEWVERDGAPVGHRGGLRGGWWLPGRNRCRAATNEHDEIYQGKQVGFRCCKDPT